MRTERRIARQARRRHWLRRLASLAALVALAAALFATWPQTFGGRISYVLVSGHSMEPTMHPGDLAVIRRQSSYRIGDVIAYRVPERDVGAGAPVIHRIVAGNAHSGFTTRGDHNPYRDRWHPRPDDIIGTRWALLPHAGNMFTHLHGTLPLAGFAALVATLTALEATKPRERRPLPVPGEPSVRLTPGRR